MAHNGDISSFPLFLEGTSLLHPGFISALHDMFTEFSNHQSVIGTTEKQTFLLGFDVGRGNTNQNSILYRVAQNPLFDRRTLLHIFEFVDVRDAMTPGHLARYIAACGVAQSHAPLLRMVYIFSRHSSFSMFGLPVDETEGHLLARAFPEFRSLWARARKMQDHRASGNMELCLLRDLLQKQAERDFFFLTRQFDDVDYQHSLPVLFWPGFLGFYYCATLDRAEYVRADLRVAGFRIDYTRDLQQASESYSRLRHCTLLMDQCLDPMPSYWDPIDAIERSVRDVSLEADLMSHEELRALLIDLGPLPFDEIIHHIELQAALADDVEHSGAC
eukprot:TRINITY_DN8990_c0_g1_i2.p1 TRINITY_DN8990_c0_g1~~TRINITY_DN8990_c0_g1_i2.p1  ORF type:complete len:331 (+),score=37.66 TRINITY_DN8990_c0_g1_i2:97-1089(+)